MRRWSILGALCALALAFAALSGVRQLPYGREMEEMALLRAMAVDREGEEVRLTVSTGRRSGQESEGALVLSALGPSLTQAARNLRGESSSHVFFGYVDQLLLGSSLLEGGSEEVLRYLARDEELSLGAQLWAVRAQGGDVVEQGGQEGIAQRLSALGSDGQNGAAGISRTAGQVLPELMEWGSSYLPALELQEDGALAPAGYGVITPQGLAGWLTGEEARGLELLAGQADSHMLRLDVEGGAAVLQVTGVYVSARPVFDGETLTGLEVSCRFTADVTEASAPVDQEALEGLCRELERVEADRAQGALNALQTMGADCLGLGRLCGLASPKHWRDIQDQWQEAFSRLEARVEVTGTVIRPGWLGAS